MMISVWAVVYLIVVHFFADFVMQTRWIGINKSSNNWILSLHIAMYTVMLLPFGVAFAVINGLLHYITDYFSSRASGYFHKKDQMWGFWTTIGFDQAIHMLCLVTTYSLLEGYA